MTDATFCVPMPPSTNELYINVPGKGRAKSKVYKAWIEEAGWEMKRQYVGCGGLPHLAGDIVLTILLPSSSNIDVDNIKALPDLLQRMGVIKNDRQIKRLHIGADSPIPPNRCCLLQLSVRNRLQLSARGNESQNQSKADHSELT